MVGAQEILADESDWMSVSRSEDEEQASAQTVPVSSAVTRCQAHAEDDALHSSVPSADTCDVPGAVPRSGAEAQAARRHPALVSLQTRDTQTADKK